LEHGALLEPRFAVAGSLACCKNLSGLKFTAAPWTRIRDRFARLFVRHLLGMTKWIWKPSMRDSSFAARVIEISNVFVEMAM
jgi:hypothetical protein